MNGDTNFEVEYKYDMEVDGLFIYVTDDYQYDASRVLKTPKLI